MDKDEEKRYQKWLDEVGGGKLHLSGRPCTENEKNGNMLLTAVNLKLIETLYMRHFSRDEITTVLATNIAHSYGLIECLKEYGTEQTISSLKKVIRDQNK